MVPLHNPVLWLFVCVIKLAAAAVRFPVDAPACDSNSGLSILQLRSKPSKVLLSQQTANEHINETKKLETFYGNVDALVKDNWRLPVPPGAHEFGQRHGCLSNASTDNEKVSLSIMNATWTSSTAHLRLQKAVQEVSEKFHDASYGCSF